MTDEIPPIRSYTVILWAKVDNREMSRWFWVNATCKENAQALAEKRCRELYGEDSVLNHISTDASS